MTQLAEGLAAIPSALYDTSCHVPHCAYCLNQTVVYRLSAFGSPIGAATDIFKMSGGTFQDLCVLCSDSNRSPPFCYCTDAINAFEYDDGTDDCHTYEEWVAFKTADKIAEEGEDDYVEPPAISYTDMEPIVAGLM